MTSRIWLCLITTVIIAHPVASQSSSEYQRSQQDLSNSVSPGAQIFLNAFETIRNYGLEQMADSVLWEKALRGLLKELNDPYAQAYNPLEFDQFRESNTGNYAGIGVQITHLNEAITITAVFNSTPAERSGLQVGDRIIGVNEISTEGWTTGNVSDSIRGKIGTTVDVTIARQGIGAAVTSTITRDSVHVTAVIADVVGDNLGYIALDRVARGSAVEVQQALEKLAGTRGIVLDLRGNPGGYLDESLKIGDLFLERGSRLASAESRSPGGTDRNIDESWNARGPEIVPGKPIIILVDRFSASASEIIAGALQDHDRALILGERTFGKGVFQNVFRLSDDRHLRLTTGEWFTPLGRSLHRRRNVQGRTLPEDPDTFPIVITAGGRELSGGGGVFPDQRISNDTLTLNERAFLSQMAQKQIPFDLRIEEFAFEQSERNRRDGSSEPTLESADFKAFVSALEEESQLEESLSTNEIQNYLRWRILPRIAQRMEKPGRSVEFRLERDPVLSEALRLLSAAQKQSDLFNESEEFPLPH
jgi:carboxyl-terminal processing protease